MSEKHPKYHRRRREVGEKEEESEGLEKEKRFVTAGDLLVINHSTREERELGVNVGEAERRK